MPEMGLKTKHTLHITNYNTTEEEKTNGKLRKSIKKINKLQTKTISRHTHKKEKAIQTT